MFTSVKFSTSGSLELNFGERFEHSRFEGWSNLVRATLIDKAGDIVETDINFHATEIFIGRNSTKLC